MGKHKKDLEHCKTWKELEEYAEYHGLPYNRSNGGHNIHSNQNGSMSFSAHEKEPGGKWLLESVRKQILELTAGLGCLFLFIYSLSYFS